MAEPVQLFDNLFATAREQKQPSFEDSLGKMAAEFRAGSNSGVGNWSIPEAFFGILMSAAAADGSLSDEEKVLIQVVAHRSRVLNQLNQNQLAALNKAAQERLSKSPSALQEACNSLPGDMRLSVYAHCVEVVLSDREFRPIEEEFLKKLIAMLGLKESEAAMILQALLIKNRY